jgi:uncharacterized protein YegP (UPF0339 family)
MAGTFEITTSISGVFLFNLRTGNGQIVLTSEPFDTEEEALRGIESVRSNAPIDERYERKSSGAGLPFFTLTTADGRIIGQSEIYLSETAMENGIAIVKVHAPGAVLAELAAA